VFDVVGSC